MDEYKEHLCRIALHDDAFLSLLLGEEENSAIASALNGRTAALVRLAATIAVDAAPYSFQHAVTHALAAGASTDEVVATLEAVTPVTGAARVVACAPKVALALGYDIEDAMELFEPSSDGSRD